jgi:hypothetical protein
MVVIRLGLWLLPFRTWRQILTVVAPVPRQRQQPTEASIRRLAGAVERVSHFVPAAACLTQALAAHVLLRRRGVLTRLHIGVAKDKEQRFMAHAWVESQGEVVIGGPRTDHFTPLLVLGDDQQ